MNEDLHDEIMRVFNQYFKAYQSWLKIQNSTSGIDVRNELTTLRQLCKSQRLYIQDWRYLHFSPKKASKRAIEMINERNQKIQNGEMKPITKLKIRHKY